MRIFSSTYLTIHLCCIVVSYTPSLLVSFRSLADLDLSNEAQTTATREVSQSGWLQWLWGNPRAQEGGAVRNDTLSAWNFEFSSEQRKNFYASIGYDSEDNSSAVVFPKEVSIIALSLWRGVLVVVFILLLTIGCN